MMGPTNGFQSLGWFRPVFEANGDKSVRFRPSGPTAAPCSQQLPERVTKFPNRSNFRRVELCHLPEGVIIES